MLLHRQKIRNKLKGRKQAPELIAKRVASLKASGKNRGWHHSPEYVAVLHNRKAFLGQKHTEEAKKKMSDAAKRREAKKREIKNGTI